MCFTHLERACPTSRVRSVWLGPSSVTVLFCFWKKGSIMLNQMNGHGWTGQLAGSFTLQLFVSAPGNANACSIYKGQNWTLQELKATQIFVSAPVGVHMCYRAPEPLRGIQACNVVGVGTPGMLRYTCFWYFPCQFSVSSSANACLAHLLALATSAPSFLFFKF